MIEKINTSGYEFISTPSENVISFLEAILESNKEPINVAEIGIGVGATSVEIAKRLRDIDSFYFFSYENDVKELDADLKATDYCKCNLYPMGNSTAIYDSYNWKLGFLYFKNNVMFDLVYLDGAHSFFHDALATVLLKSIIKPGGILIFDDVFWSFKESPTLNPDKRPQTLKEYSMEQIETYQVKMVIDIFMENDDDCERVVDINWQAVYRKII